LDIYFFLISIKIGRKPFFLLQIALFYLKSGMVNESNSITHLRGRKDGQSLVSSSIGHLMDNGDSKHIQNATVNRIHIQI
jgi:hypothetical protein